MMDYPVIADVDGDDHAEIVVCHNGYSSAMSVYGDADNSWVPARRTWNQHAYGINNIRDDLSVPIYATPNFVTHNTWHAGLTTSGVGFTDLRGEIVDVCADDCDTGTFWVSATMWNAGPSPTPPGVHATLSASINNQWQTVADYETTDVIESGWTSPGILFEIDINDLIGATSLRLRVDSTDIVPECSENNNVDSYSGALCQ